MPPPLRDVTIDAGGASLAGLLTTAADSRGVVVFAHGSGSSRLSPRNQQVAAYLNGQGLSTLLFDLLTAEENRVDILTREFRFDIELLSTRLAQAVSWARRQSELADQRLGLFGASTGAAAALIAAAQQPDDVAAVVSRGGRPDLAGKFLPAVRAPTLLLVGSDDSEVITLNRQAAAQLGAEHRLSIVPGATHLFEEPGTLEQVCEQAAAWFVEHLA